MIIEPELLKLSPEINILFINNCHSRAEIISHTCYVHIFMGPLHTSTVLFCCPSWQLRTGLLFSELALLKVQCTNKKRWNLSKDADSESAGLEKGLRLCIPNQRGVTRWPTDHTLTSMEVIKQPVLYAEFSQVLSSLSPLLNQGYGLNCVPPPKKDIWKS